MKRFGLISISMLFLILQLSGDNTERADLRVVLDLKNENSIEIGFSENAVYTMQSSVDAIDTLRLDITPEQVADNSRSPLYAYWKVMSGSNLVISLYGNESLGNLTIPDSEEEIGWNIGLLDDGQGARDASVPSDIRAYDQTQTLYTHSPSSGVQGVGSRQIGIVTDPLDNAAAGQYAAELVMDIKVE